MDKKYIYESPDKGKTVYRREFGKVERELYYREYDHYMEKMIEHDENRTSWSDREAYWRSYEFEIAGFEVVYD